MGTSICLKLVCVLSCLTASNVDLGHSVALPFRLDLRLLHATATMSASKLQTETPTPFDVLANASSFLAPELLHSSATHDSCFPPSHSSDTNGNGSTKAFHPPIDQWKPLVAQDAKGVGPYSVHRHETRFLLRCDFPGLKLESLYRLLTETTRCV